MSNPLASLTRLISKDIDDAKAAEKDRAIRMERRIRQERLTAERVARAKARWKAMGREKWEQHPDEKPARMRTQQPLTGGVATREHILLPDALNPPPDMWQTASNYLGMAHTDGELSTVEGVEWVPVRFYGVGAKKGTLPGTIGALGTWFDDHSDVMLVVPFEESAAITVEVGIANLAHAWQIEDRYLGGVTDVLNNVMKSVVPTAVAIAVGMSTDEDDPTHTGAARRAIPRIGNAELADNVVEAGEGIVEQVIEHVELPDAVKKNVHTLDWARDHLQFQVEIYGTSKVGYLGMPYVHHTWDASDLVLGRVRTGSRSKGRGCLILPVGQVRASVLDHAVPALMDTLSKAGLLA